MVSIEGTDIEGAAHFQGQNAHVWEHPQRQWESLTDDSRWGGTGEAEVSS